MHGVLHYTMEIKDPSHSSHHDYGVIEKKRSAKIWVAMRGRNRKIKFSPKMSQNKYKINTVIINSITVFILVIELTFIFLL